MSTLGVCVSHSEFYLLATALKSFFLVIVTHLLAGEVDTTLSEATLFSKFFWLLRYFNPVNLSWRYYSIFAYRSVAREWGNNQLALINHEAHPFKRPVPYVVTESVKDYEYRVKRLEPSGFFSSQALLTLVAAYQGVLVVEHTFSTQDIYFLPNITMPFAVMGLFRVMVFPWITSKVYVDSYAHPEMRKTDYRPKKWVASGWVLVLGSLVFLSTWHPVFYPPKQMFGISIEFFYVYIGVSIFLFHAVLVWHGAGAWGNRILFFDHWIYKLQTLGFTALLAYILALGIVDFVRKDYYRSCVTQA